MSAPTRRRIGAAVINVALLASWPVLARAEPNPFASPQRDADITYAMPVIGAPQATPGLTQRLRVQAATGLQRIDPPTPGTYMVTDGHTGRMMVMQPSQKLATLVPAQGGRMPPPGERATGDYQRVGVEIIAGNSCTDWRTRDQTGQESLVCLTDDGMLLQIAQNGQIRAQAIRLDRSPQPAALFAIPDGFRLQQAQAAAQAGAQASPP